MGVGLWVEVVHCWGFAIWVGFAGGCGWGRRGSGCSFSGGACAGPHCPTDTSWSSLHELELADARHSLPARWSDCYSVAASSFATCSRYSDKLWGVCVRGGGQGAAAPAGLRCSAFNICQLCGVCDVGHVAAAQRAPACDVDRSASFLSFARWAQPMCRSCTCVVSVEPQSGPQPPSLVAVVFACAVLHVHSHDT